VAAVRVAEVQAGEPAQAGQRRSPTLHAATASPWMPGVTATEWQSDTCAVRDRPAYPLALPQLVAIDDRARNARHVVDDAALNKRVYARVAEQDQRCAIIIAARITRDLARAVGRS
jgi:hypothetical protein